MKKENEGLSVTVEDVGPCKKRLAIEVPKEKIRDEFERRFQGLRTTASIPGFRRGKAPRSVIERQFGKQVEEEVKGALIWDTYQEAIGRHKLEPIGSPELGEVEFDPDRALKFDVTLEIKPTFELKEYKGLRLKKRSAAVTEEEVESALRNISLSRMQLVTEEDGEVEGGDQAICDYKVFVDGELVYQDEEVPVWVSRRLVADIPVPELLVALKGARCGETREAKTNLGSKFRLPDYRNKEATLEITVREIKRPRAPEIDDALAKQFGASSLEELKDNVRKRLEVDKKRWVEDDLRAQVYQKLVDMADFDLPEDLIAAQTDERLYRYKMELLQRGIPIEEIDKEAERLKSESHEAVVRDLKLSFVLEGIADRERIFVTEQEVERRIQEMAIVYQMAPTKMRRELEKRGSISALRHQIRESKVMDFLLKEAAIETENAKEEQKASDKDTGKEQITVEDKK